jgi:hypothetical protein
MGLAKPVVDLLIRESGHYHFQGPAVTLGVQDVPVSRADVLASFASAGARPHGGALERVVGQPRDQAITAAELLALLGVSRCATLDKFAAEGASILHDLCEPLPAALVGAFRLVVDGGTLEHVFDQPAAFRNIIDLLRVGGMVVHVSPVVGWENHGFYNISPKLLFSTYERNGFGDARGFLLHLPRSGSAAARVEECSREGFFDTNSAEERVLLVFFARKMRALSELRFPIDTHLASPVGSPRRRDWWRRVRAALRERLFSGTSSAEPARRRLDALEPLHLSEDHLHYWRLEPEFAEVYEAGATACGPGPKDRYYAMKELLLSLGRLDADTAECGVFRGLGSFILGRYAEQLPRADGFRHHCYDSFEGMSAPGDRDTPERADVRAWAPGDMAGPEEVVRGNLGGLAFVEYHKGWIPHCFSGSESLSFSFVHVDVDLYDPTRDALAFFYPRLRPGGILVLDDYGFLTCPGAHRAVEELLVTIPDRLIRLPTGQAYLVKGRSTA